MQGAVPLPADDTVEEATNIAEEDLHIDAELDSETAALLDGPIDDDDETKAGGTTMELDIPDSNVDDETRAGGTTMELDMLTGGVALLTAPADDIRVEEDII